MTETHTSSFIPHTSAKPLIICLVGPSGVGKSTIADKLCETVEDLSYLKSCTTRPRRDDRDRHYHFLGWGKILLYAGDFVAWTGFGDYHYGIRKSDIESSAGDLITAVTYSGVEDLRQHDYNVVSIGILVSEPLSIAGRTDRHDDLKRRSYASMAQEATQCDHLVINDEGHADECAARIANIIKAKRAEIQPKPWWARLWEAFNGKEKP